MACREKTTAGLAAVALTAALLIAPAPGRAATEAVRLATRAFGGRAAAEVRGLPRARAEAVITEALAEIREIEALTRPWGEADGGIGRLNAAAGPTAPDPRLLALLTRAATFCTWSAGAHGPLGGRLYDVWGVGAGGGEPPAEAARAAAVEGARCDLLRLDAEAGTAELAAGSRVDLRGFAAGFAVDRALDLLVERGVTNALVEVGGVRRGIGPGPDGRGWPVAGATPEGLGPALRQLRLREQALALITRPATYLDQRTGRPARGVRALAVVTELALDAEALAVALFVVGSREGQFRLGGLRPSPSVLWLVGDQDPGLLVDYHWGDLRRRR